MRRLPDFRSIRIVWLVLYALVSVSIGFGHKIPAASATDLAAFALPDGTLPVICANSKNDDSGNHAPSAHLSLCDACLLTAASGLVSPDSSYLGPIRETRFSKIPLTAERESIGLRAHASLGPRGPPSA